MPTLGSYLKSKYISEQSEDSLLNYASGIYFNDLLNILHNVYITPNKSTRLVPKVLATQLQECYHHEGIRLIVQYLMEKNIENIVSIGCLNSPLNGIQFKGINSSLMFLESKSMELIREAIGVHNFLDLLLNTSALWKPSNVLIWGGYKTLPFNETKQKQRTVSVRNMLYKSIANGKHKPPVPETPKLLLGLIFDDISTTQCMKKPAKRYRKVYHHLKALHINYENQKHRFAYMVENICTTSNLSPSVSRDRIIKLIHVVTYKIIPLELFGTELNRTKIMRYVPKIINGTIHSRTEIHSIIHGIKLTEIDWVKPVSNLKLTKQEFSRARMMLSCFILWLFNHFICNFISCYFHVTNNSQDERLCFYRHHMWLKLTKKYMSKYFSEHLINQPDKINTFLSFSNNKDFIGRLSLHPKRETFRLIVKPFKGKFNDRVSFMTYRKRIVRPMNSILNKIRNNNSCSSVIDIVESIYKFKAQLLNSHDELPSIHALKFDAKNAYDSLPHDLIDEIVKERLNSFTEKDVIHVQLLQHMEPTGILRGQKLIVTDGTNSSTLFTNNAKRMPKLSADSHETFCFTKDQILSYVRSQYRQTCIHTKSRSYFRKVGVFQGFPLSGTLFNIVYDYLVSELYELVGYDPETIIIRLVDDFLVLSTHENLIKKIRRLISRKLGKYNLSANRQKTVMSSEFISFTGVSVDVKTLVCYKHLKDYNNSPLHASSFSTLYKQLTSYGRMWIRHTCLFDVDYTKSGVDGALSNFVALLKSLVYN
ncbi:hypothetical protein CANINC_000294 [Pichia inconspicua]|uniref:Telomerase reverse transcriptase n=1 Tax=Pichia inconspicua TaxID=52247 RepID=A0A4V4NG89_9ASCO|nr:hypothetical protein CANINC_000294 [[Candida] inconspicua]